ncbi:MAG: THUMP domain-containing protein [Candidatus Hadarchaeales archaeon]
MVIILRVGELFLKSTKTRRRFENLLIQNLREVLHGIKFELEKERGRIYLSTKSRRALDRLTKVPGIVSLSPAVTAGPELKDIVQTTTKFASKFLKPGMSFAVRARVVGKHPFTADELNRVVGASILQALPRTTVNLSHPSLTVEIEVRGGKAYVFCERIKGAGGLPVGSEGEVVAICSGRAEEVLATWLSLKRGCSVHPVVLSHQPQRVLEQLRKLGQPMNGMLVRRRVVDGTIEGAAIALRVAGELGRKMGALAVVSAELLENLPPDLSQLDSFCPLPVLRPLAGMDLELARTCASEIGLQLEAPPPLKPAELSPAQIEETAKELLKLAREFRLKP